MRPCHGVGHNHVDNVHARRAGDGVAHAVGHGAHVALRADVKHNVHLEAGRVATAGGADTLDARARQQESDFADAAAVKPGHAGDGQRCVARLLPGFAGDGGRRHGYWPRAGLAAW